MGRNKRERKPGQATIFEVAERAGVSTATVSRVLNASAYVEPETRAKVEGAIRELGFSPRPAARALAGRRARALGLLVPEISGEFFTPMLKGIEGVAAAAEYGLLIETTRLGGASGLGSHNVDGLLLFADSAQPAAVDELARRGFPLVLLYAEARPGLGVPSVMVENEGGTFAATRHLVEAHGRRRIACLTGPGANYDAAARLRGYRAAIEAAGIAFDPVLLAPGDFSEEVAAASIRGLLAGGTRFDGVIACDDGAALGALRALREAGVEVGAEVSVVGFDDQLFAARAEPPLATLRAPTEEVGAEAARMLLRLIGGEEDVASRLFPTEFVPRASCGCRPEAAASAPPAAGRSSR